MRVATAKKIRLSFQDAAFTFRMGAGFAGEVNRTHPVSIEPMLQSANTPCTLFGQACLYDGSTNSVRPFGAGDGSVTTIVGITVRPFPIQQAQASVDYAPTGTNTAPYGGAAPPSKGAIDVLRSGFILVQLNTGQASPTKGAAVYVRTGATSGNNVQGGFETAASTSASLDSNRYQYNGPADANGIVEIIVNP